MDALREKIVEKFVEQGYEFEENNGVLTFWHPSRTHTIHVFPAEHGVEVEYVDEVGDYDDNWFRQLAQRLERNYGYEIFVDDNKLFASKGTIIPAKGRSPEEVADEIARWVVERVEEIEEA